MAESIKNRYIVEGFVNSKSGGILTWIPTIPEEELLPYTVSICDESGNELQAVTTPKNSIKVAKRTPGHYLIRIASAGEDFETHSFDIEDAVNPKITLFRGAVDAYDVNFSIGAVDDSGSIARYELLYAGGVISIDPAELKDGIYTLHLNENYVGKQAFVLYAYDAAGNFAMKKGNVTIKDATPPKFDAGFSYQADVNSKKGGILAWTAASDNSGKPLTYIVSVFRNGDLVKTVKSKKSSAKLSKLGAGQYTFTVTAQDKGKNESEAQSGKFTVSDGIAPKITMFKGFVNGYNVNLAIAAVDDSGSIARYELFYGDKTVSFTEAALTDGFYTLVLNESYVGKVPMFLRAYDAAENYAEKKLSITLKDATPPEFPKNFSGSTDLNEQGTGILSWDPATDNSGKIAKYLVTLYDESGNPIKTFSAKANFVKVSKLPVGKYSFDVTAIDGNKNSTVSGQIEFSVNGSAPEPTPTPTPEPTPSSSGTVRVFSGSTVISKAETISGCTLENSLYSMQVSSGGSAVATMIQNGAHATVSSGGLMQATTLNQGGMMFVNSGGFVRQTHLNGGNLAVSAGGSAVVNDVSSRGNLTVDGGYVESASIKKDSFLVVRNGGNVRSVGMSSGGAVIQDSGSVSGLKASKNAAVEVKNKGFATDLILVDFARANVFGGGRVSGASIQKDASIIVSDGGFVESVGIQKGGLLSLQKGASASNITVQTDGVFQTKGSVTVTNVVLGHFSGLQMDAVTGAYISGKADNSSFHMENGVISGFTLHAHSYLTVKDGGFASATMLKGIDGETGIPATGGAILVSSGGTAVALESHDSGQINVYRNGKVSSAVLADEGELYASGGYAETVTLNSGGYLWVFTSGSAKDIEVNNGGHVHVSSGGSLLSGTVTNGGFMEVVDHGIASSMNVQTGGRLVVAGARVEEVDVSGTLLFSNTFTNVDNEYVSAGPGFVNRVNVKDGGFVGVRESGTVSSAFISSGGRVDVLVTGAVEDVYVQSGGSLLISTGAAAKNVNVNTGGVLTVHESAGISGLSVQNHVIFTFFAGKDSDISGSCEGQPFQLQNGILSSFYVLEDANLNLCSGVAARELLVSGGYVTVSSGAAVSSAEVYAGHILTSSGGKASNVVVHIGGNVHLSNGASAERITVHGGYVFVESGGTISSSLAKENFILVSSGGKAVSTMVSSGGNLTLYSGGMAENLIVSSEGQVNGTTGALFTGRIELDPNAALYAMGAEINFNLVGINPNPTDCLVTNLSRVLGDASYSISVSSSQAAGTYVLASGITRTFDSMTLKIDGTEQIINSGTPFVYGGKQYQYQFDLSEGGKLEFTITAAVSGRRVKPETEPVSSEEFWNTKGMQSVPSLRMAEDSMAGGPADVLSVTSSARLSGTAASIGSLLHSSGMFNSGSLAAF